MLRETSPMPLCILSSSIRRAAGRRRGLSVIIVLGLLAITLSLSYAMMRTQMTSAQIQTNLNKRNDARQAALTGLMIGIRKMHDEDWAGVDTTLAGQLASGVSYLVHYETGDLALTEEHPQRDLYPYRVTVTSTGTAGSEGGSQTSHQASAVVQLVPRSLAEAPSNWQSLQNFTLYQWSNQTVRWEGPSRVEGPVRLAGELQFCEEYPPNSRPWHGKIDEVALFNKTLDGNEIDQIFRAGSGTFGAYVSKGPQHWWRLNESSVATTTVDSAGAAAGTLANGTLMGASGAPIGSSNYAATFDGDNDFINVGTPDVVGDKLTILAWFRADSFQHTDARIISKATGTSESQHLWMLSTTKQGSSMRLRFRLKTGGWTKTLHASSGNIQTNQWHFAAATYDGQRMRLYLDGQQVGDTWKSGAIGNDPTVPVYIGDNPPGSPRARFLQDLEAMRVAGQADQRPLTGPLQLPFSRTTDSTLSLVTDDLNVVAQDISSSDQAPVDFPVGRPSYRLYPGGKTYESYEINSLRLYGDLEPDVETNPLGIFYRNGSLILEQGATVRGTLITSGWQPDVYLAGNNIHLSPVSLPPLHGDNTPNQLPVAIVADDFRVLPTHGGSISGMVLTKDEFDWLSGSQSSRLDFRGKLLSGELRLRERSEWDSVDSGQWEERLTQFIQQLSGGEAYFPQWLAAEHNLSPEPGIVIRPADNPVNYHWPNWDDPIFVAHPSDEGLRWEIVRWIDNP